MSETKTPYTFHIDPAQLERLRELSRETGVPISEIIRRSIDLSLNQVRLVDAQIIWRAKASETGHE